MKKEELGFTLRKHYHESEVNRLSSDSADILNGQALEWIKSALEEIFSNSRVGGSNYVYLGELHHPVLGTGLARADILAWGRHRYVDPWAQVDLRQARAITVDFSFLKGRAESVMAGEVFATEYYGLDKGLDWKSSGGKKEIPFENPTEAERVASERSVEVGATAALLREAASDPELNPHLAERPVASQP